MEEVRLMAARFSGRTRAVAAGSVQASMEFSWPGDPALFYIPRPEFPRFPDACRYTCVKWTPCDIKETEMLPEVTMCDDKVGVAKRLDLDSISKDIAELAKQLGKQVEGPVQVKDLKSVEAKVQKILKS
jgi:hypothetical protein